VTNSDNRTKKSLSYKDAGVDIHAGNDLVENIKPIVKNTFRPEVLTGIGGFGSLFELPVNRYKQPVLVAGTDGVGTKLKFALLLGKHDTIGIDLVAMCVNDVIVQGAEPLFFLDYYATGKLDINVATDVIKGIAKGCELAGASLVGGETAEMPGMYQGDDYDLAGFCVGIVEKNQIIDPKKINTGDVLIGLASSGPHSNGYSLIRKVIELNNIDINQTINGTPLGELLLSPTRIYVKSILAMLAEKIDIKAISHITGGGILENIPRVLPAGYSAYLQQDSWPQPPVFKWIQETGNISNDEMYRTFNCGLGLVICVAKDAVGAAMETLQKHHEKAFIVGHVKKNQPTTTTLTVVIQ